MNIVSKNHYLFCLKLSNDFYKSALKWKRNEWNTIKTDSETAFRNCLKLSKSYLQKAKNIRKGE